MTKLNDSLQIVSVHLSTQPHLFTPTTAIDIRVNIVLKDWNFYHSFSAKIAPTYNCLGRHAAWV